LNKCLKFDRNSNNFLCSQSAGPEIQARQIQGDP
jgi:hypothetical protein